MWVLRVNVGMVGVVCAVEAVGAMRMMREKWRLKKPPVRVAKSHKR